MASTSRDNLRCHVQVKDGNRRKKSQCITIYGMSQSEVVRGLRRMAREKGVQTKPLSRGERQHAA